MSLPVFESLISQVASGAMQALDLPAEIASIAATVGEETVQMTSRAWTGSIFRIVRTTLMESPSRIQVFNLVAYPRVEFDLPLFATDVVVLRDQLRIGVIDAMPLFPEEPEYAERWVKPFLPLAEHSRTLGPRFTLKMEWSRHYLGEAACLLTGVPATALGPLGQLWNEYWQRYLTLAGNAMPLTPERRARVEAWHAEYNRDHAEVELKRNPLMKYYGAEYGTRFIQEFLFSDEIGR